MEPNVESKMLINSSKRLTSGCLLDIPKRFWLLLMVFLGFTIMYALRVNLNVAIGAMVNNHTVQINGKLVEKTAEFNWDSRLKGMVLGSLYYGYPILQLPAGWLSLKVGATRLFGYGIFLASLLTLLTEPAARFSVYALMAVRAGEGLFLGLLAPCNLEIWSKWSHPMERTIFLSIAAAGCSVGTIITMPLTGLLVTYGWPSVFYCFGGFGVLWFFAWTIIAKENPLCHKSISKKEKDYLECGNGKTDKCSDVPWKSIVTSKHVLAIVMGNITFDWGLYTVLICLPTFLLDILHFNIQESGFVAALPFVAKALLEPLSGLFADVLRRYGARTRTVRVIGFAVGMTVSSFFLVVAGYCTSPLSVVVAMCISGGFSGASHTAYTVNILDIAPTFAGILMGISNSLGSISGFLSPMVVGFLTQNKKSSEWQTVFWIAAAVSLIGTLSFCIFADDQYQPWADTTHILDKETVNILEDVPTESTCGMKEDQNVTSDKKTQS